MILPDLVAPNVAIECTMAVSYTYIHIYYPNISAKSARNVPTINRVYVQCSTLSVNFKMSRGVDDLVFQRILLVFLIYRRVMKKA